MEEIINFIFDPYLRISLRRLFIKTKRSLVSTKHNTKIKPKTKAKTLPSTCTTFQKTKAQTNKIAMIVNSSMSRSPLCVAIMLLYNKVYFQSIKPILQAPLWAKKVLFFCEFLKSVYFVCSGGMSTTCVLIVRN